MNSLASSLNDERGMMNDELKSRNQESESRSQNEKGGNRFHRFSFLLDSDSWLLASVLIPRSSFIIHRLVLFCLFMFAASMASAQDASSAAVDAAKDSSSTGKITGRVISDDGRPLSDAVVYIYKMYARVPGPPQTTTTDSDGKFQLSNLAPGLYAVNASLPGFVLVPDAATETGEAKYYRVGDSANLTLVKGGVITGTVRDANGEPVVAVAVRAIRVRDANGRALPRIFGYAPPRMTDDRGIYRLYGLQPGTYILTAGGNLGFFGLFNPYESDAPTYFPSSTRDTAAEVPVRGGEEATGIDIRYRGERGHSISGVISGAIDANARFGVNVSLMQASSGAFESTTYVQPGMKPSFSFNGVADGEYELTAQQGIGAGESAASTPRRVTVKGSDVTGVELSLAPLGSIAGRLLLEAVPKETCADRPGATFQETLVSARRDEKGQSQEATRSPFSYGSGSIATDQGEFTIQNIQTGSYRLTVRLPSNAWYVRSIALPVALLLRQPSPTSKPAEAKSASTPSVLALKTGERITGISINIAQDAANLRGRVVAAAEGASLPANLKVYLVPAERERAEDVLRYSEASLDSDGAFALTNLAPGRYFIIARPAPETDPGERMPRPLIWDAEARAKLRRDAEAANAAIELKPCQRTNDYTLRYPNREK